MGGKKQYLSTKAYHKKVKVERTEAQQRIDNNKCMDCGKPCPTAFCDACAPPMENVTSVGSRSYDQRDVQRYVSGHRVNHYGD